MDIVTVEVTPDNHAILDAVDPTDRRDGHGAMDKMTSLNNHLDSRLGKKHDWGGKYHSWLSKFGIEPETDNGWWSLAAIDQDNLDAFVEFEEGESDWVDTACNTIAAIRAINGAGRFISKSLSVKETVTLITTV